MGVAMVSILLFHQEFVKGNPILDFFNHYGHWGVQIFIFVSGFGIWYALNKGNYSLNAFYARRLIRIMPASILGGVLALALTWETSIAQNLLKISGLSLWYIRTILILYLVSPVLYVCFKGTRRTLWYVLLMFAAFAIYAVACHTMEYWWMGSWKLRQTVIWTLGQIPFYLSGMYLASESKEKSVFSFLIVLACCCFIPYVFDFAQEGEIRWLKLIHSFSVLLISAQGTILSRCLPACINRSIEWCGEHSLELYVCHEAIYTFLYKLNGAAYMLPIALVASFLAAYGISVASRAIVRLSKRWSCVA